jgi:hypothetical protein
MQTLSTANAPHSPAPFRSYFSDSLRYWEPRRIAYNAILTATCFAWLIFTWPHFRPALHFSDLLQLLVLAFIANLCYCAAYLVDIPLLHSRAATIWRRRRWLLFTAGTLFAILLTNYWIADEIYPFIQ